MIERWRGNRWLTLLILCIGFLMILVDTTIVNVSIPTLIKDLGARLSDIEWIISGYALSFAALLITFGRLGDIYGRKNFFLAGLAVFTLSSYFSGQANTPDQLILARLFQGMGGAMISPSTLSIISASFKGRERAIAFGIWGAIAGVAVAIGPLLGGYFTTYQNWRWIFYVNIPIGIIGIILGSLIIQESKDARKQQLDLLGMITSTAAFFLLVFSLIEGQNYGWWHPKQVFTVSSWSWTNTTYSIVVPAVVLGTLMLGIFLIIQTVKTRRGTDPAVPLGLFSSKAFSFGLITLAILALGEFSSLFTVPIFLQSLRGFTPMESGEALLPLALATFFTAPISARLVNRLGTKWIITIGISLEFLGLFLLSHVNTSTQYKDLVVPFIILGAGIGLAISQNTQATLSQIPFESTGSASGVLNTVRQVGSAFGVAIIGAVLASGLTTNLQKNISGIEGLPDTAKQKIVDTASITNASYGNNTPAFTIEVPTAIQKNPQALQAFITQQTAIQSTIHETIALSLTDAIAHAVRVGSYFVLVGAILSLLMPNIRHSHHEESAG